ncbi:MAG: sugar phosphate isomerase/epimerase [Puniceicoccales bacterium]|nr:sugar phosphate isomerase/epimerase [Puniceicoccales bacterium]
MSTPTSKIQFGAEVYTWFMQAGGKAYANKLDHLAAITAKAGFDGIEPMVISHLSDDYWLGDFKDPSRLADTLAANNIKLAAISLTCGWREERENEQDRAAADVALAILKRFPGARLGTVQMPSGRDHIHERRLNLVRNVNAVSKRAADAGIVCSFHPNSPPHSAIRTREDYDVVLNSLDPEVTGWTPDVGHIVRGGMNVIETLNHWDYLVNHIHYKDFSGNGPEPWAQMGTGKLDFHQITEWLVRRNYTGWIVCEDECHAAVGDPDGVTLQNGAWCAEQLRPLLNR